MGVSGARIARCAAASALVAVALSIGAGAGSASATAPDPPPGWTNPVNEWVRFTLSGTPTQGQVTDLQRATSITDPSTLLSAFADWDTSDHNQNAQPDDHGWPPGFEASGVRLERVDEWCDYTATSCRYRIVSGGGARFWVAAGPTDPDTGDRLYDAGSAQTVANEPPPPPPPTTSPGQVVANVKFENGVATFDATGSVLPGGAKPTSYEWGVSSGGGSPQTFSCTTEECTAPANIELTPGTTYDVTLTLHGSGGPLQSPQPAQFTVPDDPSPRPSPSPSPTPSPSPKPSPGSVSNPSSRGAVFSRQSRAPSALAGAKTLPTIVWLWRPEWYQGTPDAEVKPETASAPRLSGERDIVVSRGPEGADPGPWLAGVTAFGILGVGVMLRRRRRLRLLAEL